MKILKIFIILNYFLILLSYNFKEIELNLKLKHKINETTLISQETLQKIINGAEKGDRGKIR